jgi:hypothetical protein
LLPETESFTRSGSGSGFNDDDTGSIASTLISTTTATDSTVVINVNQSGVMAVDDDVLVRLKPDAFFGRQMSGCRIS